MMLASETFGGPHEKTIAIVALVAAPCAVMVVAAVWIGIGDKYICSSPACA